MGRGKRRRRQRSSRRPPSDSPVRYEAKWPKQVLNTPMWIAAILAILGMFSIALLHWGDEWGPFALAEGLFALCVFPVHFYNQKYGAPVATGAPRTAIRGLVMFLILAGIQGVAMSTLTITSYEKALYYNIAAVAEEICFRGLICRVIAGNKNHAARGVLAVAVSTALFAAGHTNYYATPAALAFIIGFGISFGILYLVWKDLAACIIGHFLLNFIVSLPILFQVSL